MTDQPVTESTPRAVSVDSVNAFLLELGFDPDKVEAVLLHRDRAFVTLYYPEEGTDARLHTYVRIERGA